MRFRTSLQTELIIFLGLVTLFVLGFQENGLPRGGNLILLIISIIAITGTGIRTYYHTYLLLSSEYIVNSGYYSFKEDRLATKEIFSVYRIPQFPLKFFGGSLMVIYSRNPEGKITHSPVREVSYSQKTLKSFLTELKRLNPDIELDPEYEQFLAGTYSLRTITKHTMQSVEQKLRDKGERW